MNTTELTKSLIIRSASSSLGKALQRTRHELGFDLKTVNKETNIPIASIDHLELGLSRKLNHAVKLALYYNRTIRIELVDPDNPQLDNLPTHQ